MCQWREYFHPICGHHTRIELLDPPPLDPLPDNKQAPNTQRARMRCDTFVPTTTNPSQCYRFEYDREQMNGLAGPEYISSHYDPDPSMPCYYPSCRGQQDINILGTDWSTIGLSKPKDFLNQPRFRIPRAGHTQEQLIAWAWTEIMYCQRLLLLYRHYCITTGAKQLMIRVCKAHRAKANPMLRKWEEWTGVIQEDLERLKEWIRSLHREREAVLSYSPYLCHPYCRGAMHLDLGCTCNQW